MIAYGTRSLTIMIVLCSPLIACVILQRLCVAAVPAVSPANRQRMESVKGEGLARGLSEPIPNEGQAAESASGGVSGAGARLHNEGQGSEPTSGGVSEADLELDPDLYVLSTTRSAGLIFNCARAVG